MKLKACSNCRRKKQKCDAADKFPNACTRCGKRGYVCELDTGRREIVAHDDREEFDLKMPDEKRKSTYAVSRFRKKRGSEYQESVVDLSFLAELPIEDEELKDNQTIIDGKDTAGASSIGNAVVISAEKQRELLAIYFRFFHPNFPILHTEFLCKDSFVLKDRVLHWSLCLVASAISNTNLQKLILDLVDNEISRRYGKTTLQKFQSSLPLIISLTLLSNWPSGTVKLQEDLSWVYSGMAVQSGLQLSLHNLTISEYQPDAVKDPSAATLVWLGIYSTNIQSSVFWGMPAIVPETHSVEWSKFARDDTPVSELLKQTKIFTILRRGTDAMAATAVHDGSRAILLQSFIDSLSNTSQYLSPMSELTELALLYCKMYLYSFMLLPGTPNSDVSKSIPALFIVVMQLPRLIQSLAEGTEAANQMRCLPQFVSRGVVVGMIIIYRVLASQFGTILDKTKALNCVAECHRCLQMLRDERGEARHHFLMLEGLKRMYISGSMSTQISSSQVRQSASVMFTGYRDFYHWREKQKTFPRVNDETGTERDREREREQRPGERGIATNDIYTSPTYEDWQLFDGDEWNRDLMATAMGIDIAFELQDLQQGQIGISIG